MDVSWVLAQPWYEPPPKQVSGEGKQAKNTWAEQSRTVGKQSIFFNGSRKRKRVALTFDDGPDNYYTVKILDILKREHVHATFFVVGKLVKRNPDVVKRILREGHCLGNHSWDHPSFTKLTDSEITDELRRTNALVKQITGKTMILVRPPFGAMNARVKHDITAQGFKIIHWSLDTKDWRGLSEQTIYQTVEHRLDPGDIILQHSAGSNHLNGTVEALPQIIHLLKENGYEMVTVEKLLGTPAYVPISK